MPGPVKLLLLVSIVFAPCATAGWNVRDAGAKGDGQTDDTAVFQRLLDKAGEAGGGVVHVPAGRYRINGHLAIPTGVTLKGTFQFAPTDMGGTPPQLTGSVLHAYADRGNAAGTPFITLAGSMSVLDGFMVTYPEWRKEDVPPVPYPPTVSAGSVINPAIMNCNFLNSYEAIHLEGCARFLVRNVHGYPSYRGLYIDVCLDIGRVENIHFWPFGTAYSPSDPYSKWVNENGVAFDLRRYDWCYVINTFCFGYGIGYRFARSPREDVRPGTTNGNLVGIGADSCERAIYIEETQKPGLQIVNAELVGRWSSQTAVCIEVAAESDNALINLSNTNFWGPIDRCIWVRSPNAHLIASSCTFAYWNVAANDAPAVQVDAGKAILQGNNFMVEGWNVEIGDQVTSAILMGNQSVGGFRVDNRAGGRTQMVANETHAVAWSKKDLLHYLIDVGEEGDSVYLLRWHHREKAGEWPDGQGVKRWSAVDSALLLPAKRGRKYTLTIEAHLPASALNDGAGLYLGDRCVLPFPAQPGTHRLEVELPAAENDTVTLDVRAGTWMPSAVHPGSVDGRVLGLAVRRIEMRAKGGPDAVFNANRGGQTAGIPAAAP